jgi:hypothetical protein
MDAGTLLVVTAVFLAALYAVIREAVADGIALARRRRAKQQGD